MYKKTERLANFGFTNSSGVMDRVCRIIGVLENFFKEKYFIDTAFRGLKVEATLRFEKGGSENGIICWCEDLNDAKYALDFMNKLKKYTKKKFEKYIREYGEYLEGETDKFKIDDDFNLFADNVLWDSYYNTIDMIEELCGIELMVIKSPEEARMKKQK